MWLLYKKWTHFRQFSLQLTSISKRRSRRCSKTAEYAGRCRTTWCPGIITSAARLWQLALSNKYVSWTLSPAATDVSFIKRLNRSMLVLPPLWIIRWITPRWFDTAKMKLKWGPFLAPTIYSARYPVKFTDGVFWCPCRSEINNRSKHSQQNIHIHMYISKRHHHFTTSKASRSFTDADKHDCSRRDNRLEEEPGTTPKKQNSGHSSLKYNANRHKCQFRPFVEKIQGAALANVADTKLKNREEVWSCKKDTIWSDFDVTRTREKTKWLRSHLRAASKASEREQN